MIADAAPAFRNGYTLAFGHDAEKVIMRWAPVNIEKQLANYIMFRRNMTFAVVMALKTN